MFCGTSKPWRYLVSSLAVTPERHSLSLCGKRWCGVPGTLFCLKWCPLSTFRHVNWRQVFHTERKICVIVSHLLQRLELAVLQSFVIYLFLPSSPLMLWWGEVRAFQREKQKKVLLQTERNNRIIQAAQTVQRCLFPSQTLLTIEVVSDTAIFSLGIK